VIPPLEDAACLGCTMKKFSIAIVFYLLLTWMDVQTNLRTPRLISRVLKLTTM
jgi:hypothetical protein